MEIFKLFGSIFVDTDAADKSMKKTEKNADGIATKLGNGIKTAAKWGAGLATAAVGAAAAVGGALVSIAESTREYRNEMGKLETAYESAGFTAEDATNTYQELNAVLGDTGQAVEASNHLAMLCDTQEDLSTWTNICTGVYAKFGASLPIEGLTEAANETAKTGALTGGLADALNWAGVSEEDFQAQLDACTTEQERQALITETLNGLYSESAQLYKENNKAVLDANAAQEKWNRATAKIGAVVEPAITKVKSFGATLLEKAIPAVSGLIGWVSEKLPAAGERFLGIVGDIGTKITELAQNYIVPMYEIYLSNFQKKFEHLAELWKTVVLPGIQNMVDAFSKIMNSIYENVQPSIETIMEKFNELSAAVRVAVEEYILPVIQTFVGMIQELYEENKDKLELIGELFGTVFARIKDVVSAVVTWFKDDFLPFLEEVKTFVEENLDKIKDTFQKAIDFVTGIIEIFIALFKGDWEGLWEAVLKTLESAFLFIRGIFELIGEAIGEKVAEIKEKVTTKFEEIKESISEKIQNAKDKVVEIFDSIATKIEEKINNAKDKVKDAIDKIKGFFNFDVSLPDIKLPHFNIQPSGWKLGDLLQGSIPSLGIDWYAKGGVMDEPTVFGINGNRLMAGGEAGPEAIAPIDVLQGYVEQAVASQNANLERTVLQILEFLKQYMPQMANLQVVMDSGALVGEITPGVDMELGRIYGRKGRNNA